MSNMKPWVVPFFRRFFILLLISTSVVLGFSEVAYRLMRGPNSSRAPKTIQLVVPAGTSAKIKAGNSISSIPEELFFVRGDVLVVQNQDSVPHELGPLWIPAGQSASLVLDQVDDFSYTCSFQPTRYLGLNVREPITWKDRLQALWYGTPPTLMFLLVYSFAVKPINFKQITTSQDSNTTQEGKA